MDTAITVGTRIRELRDRKTQEVFAEEVGINVNTLRGYETGQRMVKLEAVTQIARITGVNLDWLLTGTGPKEAFPPADNALAMPISQAEDYSSSILPKPLNWEVPVVGLATCSIDGWFNEGTIALTLPAPIDAAYSPGLVAVIAVGKSMIPDGIRQGNIVFCDPSIKPDPEDSVYIVRSDGTASIKRFISRDAIKMRLQGWLDPDENNVQRVYYEDVPLSLIAGISTVVSVKRK